MRSFGEWTQLLLDHAATGQLGAHNFLAAMSAAGLSGGLAPETVQEALTANATQTRNAGRCPRMSPR
jgi:phosphoribosylanthranilate isomerase